MSDLLTETIVSCCEILPKRFHKQATLLITEAIGLGWRKVGFWSYEKVLSSLYELKGINPATGDLERIDKYRLKESRKFLIERDKTEPTYKRIKFQTKRKRICKVWPRKPRRQTTKEK